MPNPDWMAPFTNRGDLNLTDITFPASHDAGLQEHMGGDGQSKGFSGYTALASSVDTICQYHDIAGQLEVGSRAFDLRIAKTRSGKLRTFHGEGNPLALAGGGWGQDANSIFRQVNEFLQVHTGEIVILRISHTTEKDGVHDAVLANISPERLFKGGPQNLARTALHKLRGKALVIFDKEALGTTRPSEGLHRLAKFDEKTNGGFVGEGLPVCGKYAGQFAGTLTGNQMMREMAQYALRCGNEHGTHKLLGVKHDHIFMVYWQLAWNVKPKSINPDGARNVDLDRLDDERGTHYNLDYLLNCHRGKPNMYHVTWNPKVGSTKRVSTSINSTNFMLHRPNWINLDFVCDEVCNKVIEFNNEMLPPA